MILPGFPLAGTRTRRYTRLNQQRRRSGLFKIDSLHIIVTAVVSLIATVGIVFLMDTVQPGLIVSRGGTSVFIFIGVFAANLIIEACRQRLEKNRKI